MKKALLWTMASFGVLFLLIVTFVTLGAIANQDVE